MAAELHNLWGTAVVTTTNSTALAVLSAQQIPPNNTGFYGYLKARARNTSTGASATYMTYVYGWVASTTLSVFDTIERKSEDASMFGCSLTVENLANDVTPVVNGLASTTIEWFVEIKLSVH